MKPHQTLLSKTDLLDRDLSWLAFNQRVLEEAENRNHPLLERVKFLSITASNLDEFYMVRVAGLLSRVERDMDEIRDSGLRPSELLVEIYHQTAEQVARQHECWQSLMALMAAEDIHLLRAEDAAAIPHLAEWMEDNFTENIYPQIKPVWLGEEETLPILPNLRMILTLTIRHQEEEKLSHVLIPLPESLPRFLLAPNLEGQIGSRLLPLEEIITHFATRSFPGYHVVKAGSFRLIRDAKLDIIEEADDLVSQFEDALRKRQKASIVRQVISGDIHPELLQILRQKITLPLERVTQSVGMLGIRDVMELASLPYDHLKFPAYRTRFPERINDFGGDCFAAIRAKDILVHHPYETFDVVVQYLRQAAHDPYVTTIKQTLYRTSADSPIIQALEEAARAGKDVLAIVEVKARFDEASNLQWGRRLEQAGVRVVYGLPGIKAHLKASLVTRKVGGRTERYAHLGTGNYHPISARIFSDLSYFTYDAGLCGDMEQLFIELSRTALLRDSDATQHLADNFDHFVIAPANLQRTLLQLIDEEIAFAQSDKPAAIWLKMNALVDPVLIRKLYDASRAGVEIDLVIRGICCLKPGVKGMSETIRVKSIVGRFLEHARIFCFGGGFPLPSRYTKVFISSADWMQRNMHRRVELMVPIRSGTVHEQILNQIMSANLKDMRQSWMLHGDGSYERLTYTPSSFCAHDYFMSNPSLSGRGSALAIAEQAAEDQRKNPAHGDFEYLPRIHLPRIAVIDIGSNSVRLVIYDGLKRTPLPEHNEKVLCGMARGMLTSGRLHPEGRHTALQALKRFAILLNTLNVPKIFAIATAAVRDAEDGADFVTEVKAVCGLEVRVLSGEEEARYSAMGVASVVHQPSGIMIDLGGGSLEVAQIAPPEEQQGDDLPAPISFPIGPLRLVAEKQTPEASMKSATRAVRQALQSIPLKQMMNGRTLYAVGGALRTIAKIHMQHHKHPVQVITHYEITPEALLPTLESLMAMSAEEMEVQFTLSAPRAQTLTLSAMIFQQVILFSQPSSIVFSTHGVREGVLFDQLPDEQRLQDALVTAATDEMAHIAPQHGGGETNRWVRHGLSLHRWLNPLYPEEAPNLRRLRKTACILSRIAWHNHTEYRAEMGWRWVMDAELPGITHPERVFVATALYHRYRSAQDKKLMKRAQKLLPKTWQRKAEQLGISMRLAHQLSGTIPEILEQTDLEVADQQLILTYPTALDIMNSSIVKRLNNMAQFMGLTPKIQQK